MPRVLLIAVLSLIASACDGGVSMGSDLQSSEPEVTRCAEDPECDRADLDTPMSTPQTPRTDQEAEDDTPIFELGTNVTGANTPDSFSPLVDGDELNIELGFQGLWMVVLAFRTQNIFRGKLTIITRIEVDGTNEGELGLAKQKLIPSGGGLDYYYNLFLVVLDPSVSGQTGLIDIRVSDEEGALITQTLEVQLIGGTDR